MKQSLLRISTDDAEAEPDLLTVVYQSSEVTASVKVHITRLPAPEEEESIRWYLEDYRKFPFEPGQSIAKNIARCVRELGEQLFDQLFDASREGRDLWGLLDKNLESTRIEIAAERSRWVFPWEILWNPLDIMPVACRAASFVRAGFVASMPAASKPSSVIRILLVISRPAGILDASFRSVAARLLERVDGDDKFKFEVLRPPTFKAFESALRSAAEEGRPYKIVHFDGHGVHEDPSARREGRPARRRRGYLLFETDVAVRIPVNVTADSGIVTGIPMNVTAG